MASKTKFVCASCGYESGKWLGRCPDCSAWNTFTEVTVQVSSSKGKSLIEIASSSTPQPINKVKSVSNDRVTTGFAEFDRVLGGGVVPGGVMLLSGDPGIGKSTLLLQLALKIAAAKKKVLYITGEESESQVKLRAERILGSEKEPDSLLVFSTGNIDRAIEACESEKPDLVIVDSIQTLASESFPGFPGSLPQIRHATSRLVSFAKTNFTPVFLIGHVTKEGVVAGPMLLSHMVDTVLYLEGQELTGTKILRAFKNRFGDTSEVGIFTMEEKGLIEISDTANFFRGENKKYVPGSCLTVIMEGSRPIVVEIQALVVQSNLSFPRRVTSGIPEKRLELLLAVIQKHLRLPLERMDVFVNVVGGLKISETGVDLAIVLACLSSFKNKALHSVVAVAEVGLLSELKNVTNEKLRVKEAKRLGFKNIMTSSDYVYLSDIMKNL